MIQTKMPVSYEGRGDKSGIVFIDVHSYATNKDGITFLVNDWVIKDGVKEIYQAKEVKYTNEQINALDVSILANNDFSGLSKTERDWKKIKIGLMFDTQINLLSTGKTIYGLDPNDWEFSE